MANDAIDWSRYMEGLQGKANADNTNLTGKADGVIDYQVNPDGSFYRQWKSGWLEQGGYVVSKKENMPIMLLKSYKDINYFVSLTVKNDKPYHTSSMCYVYKDMTPTGFSITGNDMTGAIGTYWYACGMGGI